MRPKLQRESGRLACGRVGEPVAWDQGVRSEAESDHVDARGDGRGQHAQPAVHAADAATNVTLVGDIAAHVVPRGCGMQCADLSGDRRLGCRRRLKTGSKQNQGEGAHEHPDRHARRPKGISVPELCHPKCIIADEDELCVDLNQLRNCQ
jgi:hypothetical protein